MTPEQMTAFIRQHGAFAAISKITNFAVPAMRDGQDFTHWRVTEANGMCLFTLHGAPHNPPPLLVERANLEARLSGLRGRAYHDVEARVESRIIQNRLNQIGAELLDSPPDAPDGILYGILCVNAPEERRGEFTAEIPRAGEHGHYPTTLLMQDEAFLVAAPF